MSTKVVMLETVHGSHLYGLARPESDLDTYRVVSNEPINDSSYKPKLKTRQRMVGKDDILETSMTQFLLKCEEGVPQALEAMFSPVATSNFEDFRKNYYLNTARFAVTYRRTVMNFARLSINDERALELLAPKGYESSLERVMESNRVAKPRRVEVHGQMKYRRHAVRLLLNRETGISEGRFNPRLSETEKNIITRVSKLEDMQFAVFIKARVDF